MDKDRLTSAEITNLWIHYIRETMAVCVSKYVLKCVNDTEITSTFQLALKLSNGHIDTLKNILPKKSFQYLSDLPIRMLI